jgi:hypothetical protein
MGKPVGRYTVGRNIHSAGSKTGPVVPAERLKVHPPTQFEWPANWNNPTVGTTGAKGKNALMVNPDELYSVSSGMFTMAKHLGKALTTWKDSAEQALAADTAGHWAEAQQMATAIRQTYDGVKSYVGDLVDAHRNAANTLSSNANNYVSTDHLNKKNIQQIAAGKTGRQTQNEINRAINSNSATVIEYGGSDEPVLPKQDQAYAAILQEGSPVDPQPTWNGVTNVTVDAPFQQVNQQVTATTLQQMLDSTKPDLITNAGQAFTGLYHQLTDTSGLLAKHAETLADQWSGTTAVKALNQMQMLQQTASDLQQNVYLAQQGMVTYGQVLSEYQQSVPQPAPVTIPSQATDPVGYQQAMAQQSANNQAADDAAQQAFNEMNGHIGSAYSLMPLTINKNLPQSSTKKTSPQDSVSGGPGGTGGSAGSAGAGGSPVSPVTGVPSGPGGSGVSGPLPSAPAQHGVITPSSPILSGVKPPPVVGPADPVTGPTPGGVPTVNPGVPSVPVGLPGVPGTGSASQGSDGDPVPGVDDVPSPASLDTPIGGLSQMPGSGGGGPGDSLATDGVSPADGVSGDSPAGFPGMGGFGSGAPGGGAGRARQAWESEDQGLWDPQDDGMLGDTPVVSADGVIGADFGPGEGLTAGGFAGPGASAGFPGGAGAGSAAAEEGAGFPMTGGGAAGRSGNDRRRQAWMQEDADIWGEEADRRVPPVIG